jgi:hypothetical protein
MKSYLFKLSLSLLLFITASFFCAAQTADDIKFEKETQKFKKVDEGHQLTFNYVFSYSGKETLTIIEPKVDCSCTEVILPEEKIEPNKTYTIIIKFDTHDKIGWQERKVNIQFVSISMDSKAIEKILIFKGMIKASKATKESYKANQKRK